MKGTGRGRSADSPLQQWVRGGALSQDREEAEMASIASIEGIGPAFASSLKSAGVRSTRQLLSKGGSVADRKTLSAKTGISEEMLLEWVRRADLMRVKGVGEEFSDLLEHVGVRSARQLARAKPDKLYADCLTIASKDRSIVRRPPSETEVRRWVEHAATLAPAVIR